MIQHCIIKYVPHTFMVRDCKHMIVYFISGMIFNDVQYNYTMILYIIKSEMIIKQ